MKTANLISLLRRQRLSTLWHPQTVLANADTRFTCIEKAQILLQRSMPRYKNGSSYCIKVFFSMNAETFKGTPPNTILEALDINMTEVTPDRVVATMPVGPKVHQPFGILHGGASVVLAESVASIGATANVDLSKQRAVGLEINANHIRSKKDGLLTATATPLHKGRKTQVWTVEIKDENDKLICTSRCTLAIIDV